MSVVGGIQGLNFVNTMNNAGLVTGANQAANIVGGLKSKIGGIAPFAPLAAGAAIFGKISSDAYEFSKDYHKAMLEVKTISKSAQADLKGVKDDILELSTKTPQSAIELAQGYYQIVSAGYDGAKALDILANSADLATSALTSTFTAADVLTSILNAYGDRAGAVTSISDKLFEVIENGKTKLDEIAPSIVNVTGLAAQAGLELDDLFAAYSVGTKTLKTEQFTTGMRGFLTAIIKPSQEAIEYAKELGLEFNTTALTTKGLIGFLEGLQTATNGNTDALAKLFPNVEGLNGLLAMFADHGKEIARQSENIANATGNVKRSMATMMEDVDNKWLVVQNKWNKSLADLGDNLRVASSGIADFVSAMLQGQGAINPEMFDFVGGMLNQVELLRAIGYGKAEAYTKAALFTKEEVSDLLSGIYNDASEGKSDVQNRLDEILGIDDAKEKLKELEQLLEDLKTGKAFEIKIFEDSDQVIKQSKAITRANIYNELVKAIKEEIEAAKKLDEVETGGSDEKQQSRLAYSERYLEIQNQIIEKQKELQDLNDKSTELGPGTDESNSNLKMRLELVKEISRLQSELAKESNQKTKPIQAKFVTNEIQTQLRFNKQLTEEERKQLNLLLRINEGEQERQKLSEDVTKGLKDTSEIIGAVSYAISEINRDLGESVGKIADMAYNASQFVENIAEGGDPITAITSGIGMLGNILGLIFQGGDYENKTEKQLEKMNRLLELQTKIMQIQMGEDWFTSANKQIDILTEKLDDAKSKLLNWAMWNPGANLPDGWMLWDPQEWLDYLSGLDDLIGPGGDMLPSLLEWVEAWADAEAAIADLKDTLYSALTGTTSDSITDSIIEGFRNGYSSAEDFADTFEELMKNAMIQALKVRALEGPINDWYEMFAQAMEDGILSPEEQQNLENYWDYIIAGAQNWIDAMEEATGIDFFGATNNIEALQGAMTGASEESVTLLFGQITALRVDTKEMSVTIDEQLSILTEALVYQKEIAENTRYNKNLEKIDTMVSELSEIKSRLS